MKLLSMILFVFLMVSCSKSDSKGQTDHLIGTWQLLEFEDTATNSSTPLPDSEADILIVFTGSDFEGTTGRNTYLGTYAADLKKLTFLEFGTTEVGESEWGKKYADAYVAAYDSDSQKYVMSYAISENILKINYTDSKNLVFERK